MFCLLYSTIFHFCSVLQVIWYNTYGHTSTNKSGHTSIYSCEDLKLYEGINEVATIAVKFRAKKEWSARHSTFTSLLKRQIWNFNCKMVLLKFCQIWLSLTDAAFMSLFTAQFCVWIFTSVWHSLWSAPAVAAGGRWHPLIFPVVVPFKTWLLIAWWNSWETSKWDNYTFISGFHKCDRTGRSHFIYNVI